MGQVIDLRSRKVEKASKDIEATANILKGMLNRPEGFHTYSRKEVEDANKHPFVVGMSLKIQYAGWGIFVDKVHVPRSNDMRVMNTWMFILKPAGCDIIEDIKEHLKHFKLSEVK